MCTMGEFYCALAGLRLGLITAMESRHRMLLDFMADLLKLPQAQIVHPMCEESLVRTTSVHRETL